MIVRKSFFLLIGLGCLVTVNAKTSTEITNNPTVIKETPSINLLKAMQNHEASSIVPQLTNAPRGGGTSSLRHQAASNTPIATSFVYFQMKHGDSKEAASNHYDSQVDENGNGHNNQYGGDGETAGNSDGQVESFEQGSGGLDAQYDQNAGASHEPPNFNSAVEEYDNGNAAGQGENEFGGFSNSGSEYSNDAGVKGSTGENYQTGTEASPGGIDEFSQVIQNAMGQLNFGGSNGYGESQNAGLGGGNNQGGGYGESQNAGLGGGNNQGGGYGESQNAGLGGGNNQGGGYDGRAGLVNVGSANDYSGSGERWTPIGQRNPYGGLTGSYGANGGAGGYGGRVSYTVGPKKSKNMNMKDDLLRKLPMLILPNMNNQKKAIEKLLKLLKNKKSPSVTIHLPDSPNLNDILKQLLKMSENSAVRVKLPKSMVGSLDKLKGSLPKIPEIKMADIKMPQIKMPELKMPKMKMPDLKLPKIDLKGLLDMLTKKPQMSMPKQQYKPKPQYKHSESRIRKIVTAYPVKKGYMTGHVVVEEYPYGKPFTGPHDDGGEPEIGCAQLDKMYIDGSGRGHKY